MSDIFNPVGRSLPGFTGPSLVTGVISDPPRSLVGAAAGTILKGTVLGRGPDGLTAVATDRGTVQVATPAQLPAGSTVTLEVRNAGDRLQVLILSVDATSARGASATPSAQAGASGGAGNVGIAAGGSGAAPSAGAGQAGDADAQANVRAQPPAIEVVGSTLRAIAVQTPAPSALLTAPEIETEAFVAPEGPVTVPADAAQKAQILAQDRLLLAAEVASASPAASSSGPGARLLAASVPLVLAATPEAGAPASSLAANTTAATTAAPPPETALQPEVSQRIAALFATADASPAKPGASPAAPVANAAGAAAAGASPQALRPGTEFKLHVLAVLPAQGAAIEIAPDAARLAGAAAPLLGRVIGFTRGGFPVIATPAGALMLQQRTRLPVGAQVALVLEPATPSAAAVLPTVTSPEDALLYLSSGWPTLDDLAAVLRGPGGMPAAMAGGMAVAQGETSAPVPPGLPQSGASLAAGIANAIAAFRSGDVERLLGPLLAAAGLPAGKEDMLRKLKDEFAQLSTLARDRTGVDWRALFLPVYDPMMGLAQINLYYRYADGGAGDDAEKKQRGTRFLVDVEFAVLGAFQLDGLIRGKRFDLMIRSRRRLSQAQRREIIGIFEETLAIGGATGGLEFRTVDAFPVSPLDELRKSHGRLTA